MLSSYPGTLLDSRFFPDYTFSVSKTNGFIIMAENRASDMYRQKQRHPQSLSKTQRLIDFT
jgi:hypothetical protein